ncbi:MAG: SpoIIE family protein phosphatase [Lentisphaerae bacterium]|nr:SpoIIE family protein phosphatase [Lentisphaerota bacterium]MCP4101931.1 SpoIIE family protein phosphatase [Lentisphaerota bacterium]
MFKNRSLAFKQSFYILTCVIIIFVVIFSFMAWQIWQVMISGVEVATMNAAKASANQLDQAFLETQRAARQMALMMENEDIDERQMEILLRSTLQSLQKDLPSVYGGSIAFKPNAFNVGQRYYMLYCCYDSDRNLKVMKPGSDKYQYFYQKWFTLPQNLDRSVWTEPYFDEGCGNILMTTYSVPFYRKVNGRRTFMGVVTIDMSLSWLRKLINSIKLHGDGYAFLISKFGRIVSHPNPSLVMDASIFSIAEENDDMELREIGRRMISGDSGYVDFRHSEIYSGKCLLFYTPLRSNDWVIGIVFPNDFLFSKINDIELRSVGIAGIGLLLLLGVVIVVSKSVTVPLRRLTAATTRIGSGNFEFNLPKVESHDEIGALNRAFGSMQKALSDYIAALKYTTAAKEKIESELNIAREIQMGILPQIRPPFPHCSEFSLYAELIPARAVGGDLYDFFFLDNEHLCFVVGDVSGKGVPASLFMAITQTLHRTIASIDKTTGQMASEVNSSLARNNDTMMFVTYFIAVLNVRTGEIEYTNAGHNPPYLVRNGKKVEHISTLHGPPLGISDTQYSTAKLKLNAGDSILLYTDGVTEAFNVEQEEFGTDKLESLLETGVSKFDTRNIVENIVSAVRKFAGSAEQSDDITVMALHYDGDKNGTDK